MISYSLFCNNIYMLMFQIIKHTMSLLVSYDPLHVVCVCMCEGEGDDVLYTVLQKSIST